MDRQCLVLWLSLLLPCAHHECILLCDLFLRSMCRDVQSVDAVGSKQFVTDWVQVVFFCALFRFLSTRSKRGYCLDRDISFLHNTSYIHCEQMQHHFLVSFCIFSFSSFIVFIEKLYHSCFWCQVELSVRLSRMKYLFSLHPLLKYILSYYGTDK